ncbi:MAG: YkgJ family cysteine cluster protein [Candidatus Thorarchaeota archaeon]|nr:YkgJ family cysteine cluster protein [Candidatus Thorarchaeota archaeon]
MSNESTEKPKSKYKFKCMEQKCSTRACHVRPNVNVTFGDLGRWTTQNYLQHILGGLTIKMLNEETGEMAIVTKRIPLKEDTDGSACIFYQEEANGCAIRFSRPISCRTYPLSFNGEKYFLSSKDCPGIGIGEATTEALKEASALAEQEFKERVETLVALPALYTVIMAPIIQQSAEAMQSLSEEDRKKMDEILSKSKPDKGGNEDNPNGQ